MQAETDKLFQKCKQSGKPFFEWHDWIMNYIESQLSKYNDFKQSRLSRIFQRGKTKLLERVEARKNKSSVARDSDAQGKKWIVSSSAIKYVLAVLLLIFTQSFIS